jgi:Domain of unknown function (DUF4192)
MNATPRKPALRIDSVAGLLAVIPNLLGFTPRDSLVVLGGAPPRGRVQVAFRYNLPDPPSISAAAGIAAHAAGVLSAQHLPTAIAVGYGPGRLVTPVADAIRQQLPGAGIDVRDVLRVEDSRYWSYACTNPSCCPPEGTPFSPATHPATAVLAEAGLAVAPSREAVAATIAPVTGPQAEVMVTATRKAERIAARIITANGPEGLDRPGLAAVHAAISTYRDGSAITSPIRHAWLALVLMRLRIRDDAWARMDPAHHRDHQRLWTDLVRRAQPGYVAAPATLLAVSAWQSGDGALANLALDRALADDPGYPMALLIRDALTAGAPPSVATPPMTPEQVADSYAAEAQVKTSDTGERTIPADPDTRTGN